MRTIENRIQDEIIPYLPERIKYALSRLDNSIVINLEEIRLRAGKPVMLCLQCSDVFLHEAGQAADKTATALQPSMEELADMVYKICENSWYAYQDDINKGFITIRGGHRIGLVGTPILDGDKIINVRDISSLNIRIAREVAGCGDKIVRYLVNGSRSIFNTLIISPPGTGKTTLLRDIIRALSDGFPPSFPGCKIGVVDERGEIAACYKGLPQNSMGCRTDVIHGVRKKEGMEMLLRSMSPNIIALDELGNPGDVSTVLQVLNAGIRILATAHGYDEKALKQRQGFQELFRESAFERFIVIAADQNSRLKTRILDGDGNVLAMDYQSGRQCIDRGKLDEGRVCFFSKAYRKSGNHTGNTGIFNGSGE